MSPETLRRVAELALVGIAAVWGVTFVMVQDAVELLPTMAFLAYRFIPAALLVAIVFRRPLLRLPPGGWRAGLLTGGFITGLFVVLTPLLGAIFLRMRVSATAWLAAAVSGLGLYLLSGAGGELELRGDGLVLLASISFAAHILATSRAVQRYDVGALLVVQLAVCGLVCLAIAAVAGQLEVPQGATVWSALAVTSLVASALGFFVQTFAQRHAPPARTALILASEPAFAGLFGWLLADDRLSAVGWIGAGLIMAAIVAVEVAPRLRPPRPLPEA